MTLDKATEQNRLHSLHKYEILDTPPDGYFDDITLLASQIFQVPIAIISLVDTDRIWFKSAHGVDMQEVPRDAGLCSSAILFDKVYVVENAAVNPHTLANPLVAGALGLKFYAAAPLLSADGYNLGTICIMDKKPREFSEKESSILMQLGKIVMQQIELKLQSRMMYRELQPGNK